MASTKQIGGSPRVKFLPRLKIREFDRNERCFSSHHDTVEYDDNLSLSYATGSTVNYPTTLPSDINTMMAHVSGWRGETTYLNYLTSSLQTTGTVTRRATNEILRNKYTGSIAPFKEHGLHEQDNRLVTSSFYITGSQVRDVGLGLTNPIKDKHALRFELYVSGDTPLQAESGSAYYYNSTLKTFEEVAPQLRCSPSGSKIAPNDFRLFGPTGHMLISGTHFFTSEGFTQAFTIPSWTITSNPTRDNVSKLLSFRESGSFCLSGAFDASTNQLFSMKNWIKYPFVVESALINIPLKAGASWLNDKTTLHVSDNLGQPGEAGQFFSLGGPCINFAILNQFSDRKDVILSASLVPSGDLVEEAYVSTTEDELTTIRCGKGFNVFGGTAAGFVSGSGTYTGSVTLQAKAGVMNGFITNGVVNKFQNSTITAVNNIGRAQESEGSSRSIFGKEYTYKGGLENQSNIFVDWFGTLADDGIDASYDAPMWVYMKGENSPYVLMPEDNISFLITKHRSSQLLDTTTLSASHDVKISEGEVTVTLYGSFLQGGTEFKHTVPLNDTRRSQEAENTVLAMKTIGNVPVLDQFSSYAYVDQLSGSYLDYYVTGSMAAGSVSRSLVLHQFNPAEKTSLQHPRLSINSQPPSELLNGFVHAKLYSSREYYYNTLVPNPSDIWKKDSLSPNVTTGGQVIFIIDDEGETTSNNVWSKSFPFEPRYDSIPRYMYDTLKYQGTVSGSVTKISNSPFVQIKSGLIEYYYSDNLSGVTTLTQSDFMRVFFGSGDFFTYSTSTGYGSTNFADFRKKIAFGLNYYAISPIVRSWKYGLMNGIATKTSLIMNSRSHGQFRDMLEQREDSKMHMVSDPTAQSIVLKKSSFNVDSPITVKFVDENGKLTNAEKTNSSNLSLYCTSSLPFFDGTSRNRDALNLNLINNTLVSVEDDGLGNLKIT